MIIDSHCHLHDEKFDSDLKEVLERAQAVHITHMITIGCDIATTKRAQAVAERLPQVFFSAGFHPHEAKHLDDDAFAKLTTLAKHEKCVAIGECGLDYYYLHSSKDEQQQALVKQLDLASQLNLPVIIHLRDAFDDCVNLLKKHRDLTQPTVIHCFSGTLTEAKIFETLGCYISLSGIITFKKPGDLPAVAKTIALTKLLVETDCPYLAPHPFRGQRNEPAYIIHTLRAIADARGQDLESVKAQIHQNTWQFFGLGQKIAK